MTEKEGIRQGIYYFHQVQSCVWFAGAFQWPSAAPEHGPLGWMTATFRGTLSSDFTIRGEWVDARNEVEPLPGTGGSITLKIDRGSTDVLRLLYVEGTGQPFLEPGFREEQSWIKISDDDAYPPAESPS